jgi:hypothetical protein
MKSSGGHTVLKGGDGRVEEYNKEMQMKDETRFAQDMPICIGDVQGVFNGEGILLYVSVLL